MRRDVDRCTCCDNPKGTAASRSLRPARSARVDWTSTKRYAKKEKNAPTSGVLNRTARPNKTVSLGSNSTLGVPRQHLAIWDHRRSIFRFQVRSAYCGSHGGPTSLGANSGGASNVTDCATLIAALVYCRRAGLLLLQSCRGLTTRPCPIADFAIPRRSRL